MDLRQVQYFLSIATTGSFSSAAEELYISQSSLSKQIIALERELGFQLFDRSKRKVSLTKAGETFLKHAPRLVEIYQGIWADLDKYRAETATFSIAAIPAIAQYGITDYIAEFQKIYPHIRFNLEEREGQSILPSLDAHEYDLGFIRDNYLNRDQYNGIEICKDKLLVAVSNKHPNAHRTSIALAELANENFIMFDKVAILHEVTMQACKQAGFTPRIFYASVRIESILGLVAANVGIALMPERIFNYNKPSDVLAIPLEETIESNISLNYLKDRKLPMSAKIFVATIEKLLAVKTQ
jgi:LysR family transcriptional activator of glutamate synthase operon